MNFLEAMKAIVDNPKLVAYPIVPLSEPLFVIPFLQYGQYQLGGGFCWGGKHRGFIPEPEMLFAEWEVEELTFNREKIYD